MFWLLKRDNFFFLYFLSLIIKYNISTFQRFTYLLFKSEPKIINKLITYILIFIYDVFVSLSFQTAIPVRRSESSHVHRRRPCHPNGFSHSSSDQSVGEVHRCCEYRDEATSVTVALTAYPVTRHSVGYGPVHVQRDFNQSSGTIIQLQLYGSHSINHCLPD